MLLHCYSCLHEAMFRELQCEWTWTMRWPQSLSKIVYTILRTDTPIKMVALIKEKDLRGCCSACRQNGDAPSTNVLQPPVVAPVHLSSEKWETRSPQRCTISHAAFPRNSIFFGQYVSFAAGSPRTNAFSATSDCGFYLPVTTSTSCFSWQKRRIMLLLFHRLSVRVSAVDTVTYLPTDEKQSQVRSNQNCFIPRAWSAAHLAIFSSQSKHVLLEKRLITWPKAHTLLRSGETTSETRCLERHSLHRPAPLVPPTR